MEKLNLSNYQQTVKDLSDRIVKAQQPIRLLDAIKWDATIQEEFFKYKFKRLPNVTAKYYELNTLNFDPALKLEEFYDIERDIRRHLGQFNSVANLMQRMCREYRELIRLLISRGQPEFAKLTQKLYGSSEDAFFAGAPNLNDLAQMISAALGGFNQCLINDLDKKCYSSEQAVAKLQERMDQYFNNTERRIRVVMSDGIIADAAAGADVIKLRKGIYFSERDIRVLEVHEGWVHIGTTLNGLEQPICTFLSKGTPSATVTQEGLAILMEIFTFASYPGRVRRLTNRITAIHMAEKGADFIEVFNFFREQGLLEEESYSNTVRVFRGSLPNGGPFTKDLSYSKGFVLIYNYIQAAIQRGMLNRIPLLFTGKTSLEDLRILESLVAEKLVVPPKFVPSQFSDLAALSAWMCYSNFLNRLNLERVAGDFADHL